MKTKNKAKKVILTIAIAVLFVLFIAYAIETIYPSSKYDDFCRAEKPIMNQSECEASNFTWISYEPETSAKESLKGYCDMFSQCAKEFDSSREIYNRNVFFISLGIGILAVIISVLLAVDAVSIGILAGGVLLIIYGTIRYWGSLSDLLRTLMLAFALGILIWLGYRKLR